VGTLQKRFPPLTETSIVTSLQARRQDVAAGEAKNQKEGPKTKRGASFLKYCIGCMEQPGSKREMGGHRFQMGGGASTTAPPLATALRLWLPQSIFIAFDDI